VRWGTGTDHTTLQLLVFALASAPVPGTGIRTGSRKYLSTGESCRPHADMTTGSLGLFEHR
jgi:hypothetical protein